MISLFLVEGQFGKEGVASKEVEEFIKKNKPKSIPIDLATMLSFENVFINVDSKKTCLMTGFGALPYRVKYREEADKHKAVILEFVPKLKGKNIIVFVPGTSGVGEEYSAIPVPHLSDVVAEIERVMNMEVKLPESLVELPSMFSKDKKNLPVFFFKSEAVKEALSMIKNLEKFVSDEKELEIS